MINIDDQALIIKNFLPEELFKKITNFKYNKTKSSHKTWNENLYKDDRKSVTMKEVKFSNTIASIERGKIKTDDPIFEEFIKILIKCPSIPYQVNSRLVIVYYEYEKLSGINWHDDHGYVYGLTYYLNRRWSHQWGGEFMFRDKIQCGYLPVVGNSLIIIKAPGMHKVNPVLSPIVPRITIQSFVA